MQSNSNISRLSFDECDMVSISHSRLKFMTILIATMFLVLIVRLFMINLMTKEEIRSYSNNMASYTDFVVRRNDIVDRNGILLATNIATASLYANPQEITDLPLLAKKLSLIVANLSYDEVISRLSNKNKQFVWLKRHIAPQDQQKVNNLGIPGLYFYPDEKRVYLHGNVTSHVLGFVDIDGVGIAGIEQYFNDTLGRAEGDAFKTSIDIRVQNILHDELDKAVKEHSAIGGSGIVMDIKTGEIISLVSLPDFDPHNIEHATEKQRFNQATLGLFEMGSTMKILTLAIGLDTNTINVNDAFDVSQPIKIAKYTIHDYRGKGGPLSVPEILIHSSNLGTAQIVTKFGARKQRQYLQNFGILSKVNLELPEISKPLYPSESAWKEVSMVTISYGHGIAITPIHAVQAISTVINGGRLVKPPLVKVVEYGSGKKAKVNGYYVGGKTGTAEKVSNGRYLKHANLVSFIGAFPIHDPKYVILVMVDEPKAGSSNSGFATGGMVAAPLAGSFIKRIAPILNMEPVLGEAQDEVAKMLHIDFNPRYKPEMFANKRR